MTWIAERDANDPTLVHQALVLQGDAPLAPALVEFWQRILADGGAAAASSACKSLSIEICEKQTEDDSQGYIRAMFRDALNKPCKGMGHYYLRSDALACLEEAGEDIKTHSRKQTRWYLAQYAALKAAARSPDVAERLAAIERIRPLIVRAASGYGWFDLQLGQYSFGPLPAEDQANLQHRDAAPADLLHDLIGGREADAVLQELTAALVA